MKFLSQIAIATCSFAVFATSWVQAQSLPTTEFFLKVDGVPGESTATGHQGEIDVASFQLGVQQRGISDFGGGAAAGKSTFTPIKVLKPVDKASPALFLFCATGKHIPQVQLTARKAGGEQVEYLKITLSDVLVSSVNHESADQDGRNVLLESVSLNFSKIEFTYIPTNDVGAPGTPVKVSFDLRKNKGGAIIQVPL